MFRNLAHPRKRSVSVGPQSAADAYETLAYRKRRRRESASSLDGTVPEEQAWSSGDREKGPDSLKPPPTANNLAPLGANLLPTPMASRVHSFEHMMGTGLPDKATITPPESDVDFAGDVMQSPVEEENEKRELFMRLTKPRVRYDVEVITKLIIYSGKFLKII
jgi:hypothetical protein